jgi:hypothetical protein
VEQIVKALPTYMMVGILVVIGISQLHRFAGAVLGIVFWLSVALVGTTAYDRGDAIGIGTLQFSRGLFYAICGFFVVVNVGMAVSAWINLKRRRRRAQAEAADDAPAARDP